MTMRPMCRHELIMLVKNSEICPPVVVLDRKTGHLDSAVLDIDDNETVIAIVDDVDCTRKYLSTYSIDWIAYNV